MRNGERLRHGRLQRMCLDRDFETNHFANQPRISGRRVEHRLGLDPPAIRDDRFNLPVLNFDAGDFGLLMNVTAAPIDSASERPHDRVVPNDSAGWVIQRRLNRKAAVSNTFKSGTIR